nr:MAG TPA: hypothetical protein [Caudoviricetes sp.]
MRDTGFLVLGPFSLTIKHPPSYFKSLLLYTKNHHSQRLLGNTQIDKL